MGASCDPHYTQVITSICRQPMDTKLSRDSQFSQLFEEAIEVSMKLCIYCTRTNFRGTDISRMPQIHIFAILFSRITGFCIGRLCVHYYKI